MIAVSLRRIEKALLALAAQTADDHPIDPHDINVIAKQVAAQAEMLEQELDV